MVGGDDGPAVAELADVALARVDHRLDREGHAGLELRALVGAPIVQDLRLFVKALADPVAAEFAHDAVPIALGMALDGEADIAEGRAGAHRGDALPHALVG